MRERYNGRIQNVFSDFICLEDERIYRDLDLPFLYRYAEWWSYEWMSVGNDRMVEMFSLHSIYSYVLSS